MIISTIVKASAQMAVVTEIAVGDVYKRLEVPSYGNPKIVLGLVSDVMQNGEKTAVTAIEFTPPEYGSGPVEPKMVTFAGDQDVSIYPVGKDEFAALIADLEKAQDGVVEAAEKDLTRKSAVLTRIRALQRQGVTEATTRMLQA